MEKELYQKFKERRARGRKVSGRWLSAMARRLLSMSSPAETVASFSGGKTWRRRFCRRYNIGLRRKTNAKNKTWAETEPVLLRYFATLRRRLQLEAPDGQAPTYEGEEEEPEDVNPVLEPQQEEAEDTAELPLDSSDDEDQEDVLITAEAALPAGYRWALPPDAEALEYKHAQGAQLVARLILFNWKAVGWCAGVIKGVNQH